MLKRVKVPEEFSRQEKTEPSIEEASYFDTDYVIKRTLDRVIEELTKIRKELDAPYPKELSGVWGQPSKEDLKAVEVSDNQMGKMKKHTKAIAAAMKIKAKKVKKLKEAKRKNVAESKSGYVEKQGQLKGKVVHKTPKMTGEELGTLENLWPQIKKEDAEVSEEVVNLITKTTYPPKKKLNIRNRD